MSGKRLFVIHSTYCTNKAMVYQTNNYSDNIREDVLDGENVSWFLKV